MALITAFTACNKDVPNGPNDLSGDPNIPLTQVGKESSVYMQVGSSSNPISGTVTVLSNDNGLVTYQIVLDFTGHPDSALYAPLIPADLKDSQGRINTTIKYKFTSEGVQDFYWGGGTNPWTIVKYADEVGTEYPFNTSDGLSMKRVITEKTGVDEWPLGFYYIKTTKVEQQMPADDQYVNKISYRANHKFGLVYMEAEMKSGQTISMSIVPFFMF